eukprot:1432973-Rhodomonas_salina.1
MASSVFLQNMVAYRKCPPSPLSRLPDALQTAQHASRITEQHQQNIDRVSPSMSRPVEWTGNALL